jgi:hypothetical protein
MAYAAVFLLVLAYGVLTPLGLRVQWAERQLLLSLFPPEAGARALEGARNVIHRGWPSLVASELWLLLLLAACIGVFLKWWLLLALPITGWVLARLLDRQNPYPRTMDWYVGQFLRQAERSRARAEIEGDEAAVARILRLQAEIEASRETLGALRVQTLRR